MKLLKISFLFALGIFLIGACSDDGGPADLTVMSITAEGTSFENGADVTKDLNSATAVIDVALNSNITIVFDREVDATSVSSSTVSLSNADGDVAATVSASGMTVTVDPDADMTRGTQHTLSISGVRASDEGMLTALTRTFTTEGRAPVVVPNADNMIAYYNFDGTTDDVVGDFDPNYEAALTFGEDRFGQLNSTATFDGDETIIEVPGGDGLMAADDYTVSFWMKTNSVDHVNADGDPASYFVFGLGAFFGFQFEVPANFGSCKLAMSYENSEGDTYGEDLWFNGSGEDKDNGGWQGWDFVADLTGSGGVEGIIKDKWVHIVCTYNAAERQGTMYMNGTLMKSQDFDLWPDGDVKRTTSGVNYRGTSPEVEPELAFGFIQSRAGELWDAEPWGGYDFPTANHFKGDLDDVRFFDAPFSANDVEALYDAEK